MSIRRCGLQCLAADGARSILTQVAFLAGLMYTVIGLLRLGWITQYLSQPVISGFMSGACITIAMSQVGPGQMRQDIASRAACRPHANVPQVKGRLLSVDNTNVLRILHFLVTSVPPSRGQRVDRLYAYSVPGCAASPQVKYLMGLKVPRFDKLQDTCSNLVANLNYFNWREYVVRACCHVACTHIWLVFNGAQCFLQTILTQLSSRGAALSTSVHILSEQWQSCVT